MSDSGNPSIVVGNHRLTVFAQDAGFKFCVARADRDDREPYFSDVYQTADQAKDCALAYLNSRPSPHVSMTENWREQRSVRARQHLADTTSRLIELAKDATGAKNVTALRKVEAKAASTAKSMRLAIDRALHDRLSDSDIINAEGLRDQADRLLAAIQKRIAELKSG
ncbi:hypothetical protein SLT36_21520 [Aminobacter sp. BA135]|uniref:hypothetical protein n=1 Tax=Aminobacter sp. BA135 TaxID=537596 RepID=UPI003D78B42C